MQRRSGGDARVIVGQFRAEVQAFLEVGLPARQLPAHREIPAPRVPPSSIRMASFVWSGSAKNWRLSDSRRVCNASSTPWPMM